MVFAAKALAERMHNGLAAAGSPACGCRCRRSGRTAGKSPGCGGTTACFPRSRWPSASAGSWPTVRPARWATRTAVRIPAPHRAERTNHRWLSDRASGVDERGGDDERSWRAGSGCCGWSPISWSATQGRQLGLWGDAVVSDRVARAAVRVQAMLGHDAVTRPVLAGGRGPAEQVTLVPFGGADDRGPAAPGRAGQAGSADGPGEGARRTGRAGPGRGGFPRRSGHGLPGPAARQDHRRLGCHGGRQRARAGLRAARPDVRRRRAVAGGHRLGRAMAGCRAVVGSTRRAQAGQIPAGHRGRERPGWWPCRTAAG